MPAPVDLALIALTADMVVDTVTAGANQGVRTAILFSTGFAEIGGAGEALQQGIAAVAGEYGRRILGPTAWVRSIFVLA